MLELLGLGAPIYPKNTIWSQNHSILIQGPNTDTPYPYSIEEFETSTSVKYLSSLAFKNRRTQYLIEQQCKSAITSQILNTEVKWLGACFAKEISNGWLHDVMVKWIDDKVGFGLYANTPIKKWDYIGEYTGLVRSYIPFWTNINPYCYRYPSSSFGWRTFTIDARFHGNEIRYINHSNHPNCESIVALHNGIFHMCIRAIKDIPAGMQLCYDYGNNYLRSEKPLPDIS